MGSADLRMSVLVPFQALGAPTALQAYVLQVIETGSVSLSHVGPSEGNGPLNQIIEAGYTAVTSALNAALYLSAGLLAAAALLSAVTLRPRGRAPLCDSKSQDSGS